MAIDWTIPRLGVYRFYRVAYSSRQELELLTTIQTGEKVGRITRNVNAELKESGSLPCVDPPAMGDDLVRIYYVVEDDNGQEESIPLATMHAVKTAALYTAAAQTSDLELFSALLTLEQATPTESLVIAAGSVAVTEAAAICTDLGLPVVLTPGTKTLGVDAAWNAGKPYREIVNNLLGYASYWSAGVDGWGRVILAPYEDPTYRAPVWDFVSGLNCIYLPDVTLESDAFEVPNVCVITSSNPEAALTGSYTNDDPASPYSTVTRGRSITLVKTVDDAVDEADLNARARIALVNATGAAETLTIEHAYAPVAPGDVVTFAYERHGLTMRASILSQELSLGPACRTRSILKRVWT